MTDLSTALETLPLLPDWEARYTFVIALAKHLPPMPDDAKTEVNKVPGCTSQVWMTHRWNEEGRLELQVDSDAFIVRGLLALVQLAYQGKTREEVAALDLDAALEPTGLLQHLSPNRRNGFTAVLTRLKSL